MGRRMWTACMAAAGLLAPPALRAAAAEREPLGRDNFVLGTQTFAPAYQFTNKTRLVETAEAIRDMGSNVIKFDLSRRAFRGYGLPPRDDIRTLADMALKEPSCRSVLDMPFRYYLFWAYPHGLANSPSHAWRDGLSEDERRVEYAELYQLARRLLQQYAGSGKVFLVGHWEGDWALLGSFDPRRDPAPAAVEGMIAWLRVRQQAIDDARRDAQARGVAVYHYTEVNLVRKAMAGGRTVTNDVLPRADVDYVSYSAYDSLNPPDGNLDRSLREALDHIESKLPAKSNLGARRVFLGEYGFPLERVKTPERQAERARAAARAALAWGCPFALYWQMYCNELRDGRHRGFWLIDDRGRKQPAYALHRRYLEQARRWTAAFHQRRRRPPTLDEFRRAALQWLDDAGR